ncbi:Hypothetical predicted protein [Pelobates cultripes]|uniref:Uncharacterized protein n=1 Tax=Pelobates cultripes TaxID=61616 RepID=A0AAD1TFK1_PELCU|nr:Hypothetical predicted protein [Pelobates cultripes]
MQPHHHTNTRKTPRKPQSLRTQVHAGQHTATSRPTKRHSTTQRKTGKKRRATGHDLHKRTCYRPTFSIPDHTEVNRSDPSNNSTKQDTHQAMIPPGEKKGDTTCPIRCPGSFPNQGIG